MVARDTVTRSRKWRPGPAVVILLLAVLLVTASALREGVELRFFDFLQRQHRDAGSPRVVLLDTTDLKRPPGASLWHAPDFAQLLRTIDGAGARLIVPVQPPPAGLALPDLGRLAELQDLERRTSATAGDSGQDKQSLENFTRQLDSMRNQFEQQVKVIQAASEGNTLMLPLASATGDVSAELSACGATLFQLTAESQAALAALSPVRAISEPGDGLCRSARGSGHVEFPGDEDGIVRRTPLALRAGNRLIPAVALAVLLADAGSSPPVLLVQADNISWSGDRIRTEPGLTVINHYYQAARNQTAFATFDASALLDGGTDPRQLKGRIVVLGDLHEAGGMSYATPLTDGVSPLVMTATSISNLLDGDYLVRPGWLRWLELASLFAIVGALAAGRRRLPTPVLILSAMCLATGLLMLEAWMLWSEHVWIQATSAAIFCILAVGILQLLEGRAQPAQHHPQTARHAVAADKPGPEATEEELDLTFSVLRQQPPSDNVKSRLYDIAISHVRNRDLAKAERVLRFLANLDPGYRGVRDKLSKLVGLRAGIRDGESSTAGAEAAPEPAVEIPTRRHLGRYEIDRVLGRGAMATVYLGRDPKINRRVAIKTIALAEEFSDSELATARNQFIREAESAGRLNHPTIISVYDVGEDDDIAYLAMEYFPGKPLTHFAQQGKLLAPKKVLDLIARAADALHYAHGQRVVHRDIKPANLLYDPETDTLKITDFGIARLTDSSRTKTGIILGTPSYMSPEQLAGTEVTGQSDIFSLGITMYQMLTGMPPFRADSIPRLMQRIAKEKHESVRGIRNDVPAEVDEILDRALEKNPDERFPSARAMALAIRDCCSRFVAPTAMRA